MNYTRSALGSLALVAAFLIAACGGRDSVASRSATAYDDAKKKGVAIGGGHEHGGHAASETATHDESWQMPGMDHSTTQGGSMSGMDHSKMQGGQMSGMDHSKMQGGQMPGMDHSKMQGGQMSGMDHSKMQGGQMSGMDHSKMQGGQMPGMDHSKMQSGQMPGMDHSKMQSGQMSGMDHSKMQGGQMSGMDHPQHAIAPQTAPPAPASTAAVARLSPAATLSTDAFDAPAAISVAEAVKAANNVPDGEIRHVVPGQDHENPPTPQPAIRGGQTSPTGHEQHGTTPAPKTGIPGHAGHGGAPAGASATPRAEIYTCPMHPEVTSDKPGTCPKCGMAMVKKK
jgi:uncharacterized protein involved in copper resistance